MLLKMKHAVVITVCCWTAVAHADDNPLRLTLAAAVKLAAEKNLSVRAELYNPAQQEAELRKSSGMYDPALQVLGAYTNSTTADVALNNMPTNAGSQVTQFNATLNQLLLTGGTAGIVFNNTYFTTDSASSRLPSYWQSSLGVTFSQPLLKNFGREVTELTIDSARLNKFASIEHFNAVLNALVAQVRTEYYKLYSLQEAWEVKKVSLELARKILSETQGRVKAGVMPAMEILNAEFGVASREKDLIDAERAVKDQIDVLRQLLQLEGVTAINPVDAPSRSRYEVSEPDEIKRAIANRPDLKELKRNLELLELQTRVAGNRVRPDLTFNASVSSTGVSSGYNQTIDKVGTFDYPAWGLGLTFTYPLGNRAAENDYRKNRLKVEQIALQIRNQEELVVNEVRAAVRAINANFKQLEVADRGRAFAEERFKAFVRKAEVGLATNKDVLDVENDLATAKNNQISAQVAHANAITQLWKSTGDLLEKEQIRLVERNIEAIYKNLR